MEAKFYLKKLIIQNFATFKNQTISFRPGFNAIVGETGSGKSLVLDALQLILGGRADKKVVRRETDFALIEASFLCTDPKIKNNLESEGYPLEGNELVIKRLIYKNGSTKNYINHLSCTVGFLSALSRKHIDMVGQFENQKLLSESYQLLLLDQFGKLGDRTRSYQRLLQEYKHYLKEKEELTSSQQHRDQRLDYLNYQLQEIEKLNPSSQDEEDLLRKKDLMLNLEKKQKLGFQIAEIFDGIEGQEGLFNHLRSLGSLLRKNLDILQSPMEIFSEVEDRIYTLKQNLDGQLSEEIDPSNLESVLERLDFYQRIKKKFGGTVETVLQTQVEFLKERGQLEELEISMDQISKKIDSSFRELRSFSEALHLDRIKHAQKLGQELTQKVRALKMEGATIRVDVEKNEELMETGISKVSLKAETNKGEGYFKIKETASGGELSRILLGLRQILSSHDSINIFLFDEIDTGIGGETANCIGKALSEVAHTGQVIAITHLPQIAQFGENLIVVHKEIQGEKGRSRTESSVREVYGRDIKKEVRAMVQI